MVLRRRRNVLVDLGKVAGVEDRKRSVEEDADDPSQERDVDEKADHEAVDRCDDDEDDDRDDPGPPTEFADVSEDHAEVERLTEAVRVSEPQDGKQGDERHDKRNEPCKKETSYKAQRCGACRRRVATGRRICEETDCTEPTEHQEHDDRWDHVDQHDDVPLPPIDEEPAPVVNFAGWGLSGEHPHHIAAEERD